MLDILYIIIILYHSGGNIIKILSNYYIIIFNLYVFIQGPSFKSDDLLAAINNFCWGSTWW